MLTMQWNNLTATLSLEKKLYLTTDTYHVFQATSDSWRQGCRLLHYFTQKEVMAVAMQPHTG